MLTIEVLPEPELPNSAVDAAVAFEFGGEREIAEPFLDVDREHRQSPW